MKPPSGGEMGACCRNPEAAHFAAEGSLDAISVSDHLTCNQTPNELSKIVRTKPHN